MDWLRRAMYTGFLLFLPIGHTAGAANSEFFLLCCKDKVIINTLLRGF